MTSVGKYLLSSTDTEELTCHISFFDFENNVCKYVSSVSVTLVSRMFVGKFLSSIIGKRKTNRLSAFYQSLDQMDPIYLCLCYG